MVSKVVELICYGYPQEFINGLSLLRQNRKREAAHMSTASRFPGSHLSGWAYPVSVSADFRGKPLVIIDDVVTTGSSFEDAVYFMTHKEYLDCPWNPSDIWCYAYAKTVKLQSCYKPYLIRKEKRLSIDEYIDTFAGGGPG